MSVCHSCPTSPFPLLSCPVLRCLALNPQTGVVISADSKGTCDGLGQGRSADWVCCAVCYSISHNWLTTTIIIITAAAAVAAAVVAAAALVVTLQA